MVGQMTGNILPVTAPLPASVDMLVAGSGAAGLVAALAAAKSGATVLVAEAGGSIGGTSAISGGRVWVPVNHYELQAGIADSVEEAVEYFLASSPGSEIELVRAFVTTAPTMAAWIESTTAHRFVPCLEYPDYYAELPGGKAGGRALDSAPLDTRPLAAVADLIRESPSVLPITHEQWRLWRCAHKFDWALIDQRRARGITAGGRALTAALLHACLAAGVEVATEARVVDLVEDSCGGVKGATIDRQGRGQRVESRACVLATGGFEWDADLRQRHLREPVAAFGSPPTNRGDAVVLTCGIGAALDRMDEAWWMPMVHVPGEQIEGQPFFRSLITERGLPRSILVNAKGSRFTNEALPYNDLVKAIKLCDSSGATPNTPAWLIFDEGFRSRYSLATIRPDRPLPSWLIRAPDLAVLASHLGIPGAGLTRAVEEWNQVCASGHDEYFGRGQTVYERYYGDPDAENPNLGPIDSPSFYAIPVLAGTIGTKGGPRVDRHARVLRPGGDPVVGLYAAGNAAAGWVGTGYPGPGTPLSVGMTFAYRAARHAMGATDRKRS